VTTKEERKSLPIWQIVLGIAATLALVGLVFARSGGGEASKEELATMRKVQENRPLVIPQHEGSSNPRQQ